MEAEDFPTSPAKRQRTVSPTENRPLAPVLEPSFKDAIENLANVASIPQQEPAQATQSGNIEQQVVQSQEPSSNSLLDGLMLQVEAESSSRPVATLEDFSPISRDTARKEQMENDKDVATAYQNAQAGAQEHAGTNGISNADEPMDLTEAPVPAQGSNERLHAEAGPDTSATIPTLGDSVNTPTTIDNAAKDVASTDNTLVREEATVQTLTNGISGPALPLKLTDTTAPSHNVLQDMTAEIALDTNATIPTVGNAADAPAIFDPSAMDAIPSDNTLVPEADADGGQWELDSSPYVSSSDSDSFSDDSSSEEDSDDDEDGDYAMLDPEEAARILMQGDGGSDDEGDGIRKKEGGLLRTANERLEEVIPKPDIVVTEDMKIEELGNVELVVESTVVIKAKTSGEYQVLEPGSLICLKDRSVVGVVADLIGRVEEPRYTIRFTNDDDIREACLSETGTTVYYVPDHSTFVFTLPLKAVKGSDASNFHDEEVGAEEMEFSDDEAEAEHKRQMKAKRQGRTLESTGRGGRGGSKFPRGSHRGGGRGHFTGHTFNNADGSVYGDGSLEINYDDVPMPDTNEDGYTPLQRPADLADIMTRAEQPQEHAMPTLLPPAPPPSHFRRGGDYGGRGRGRGYDRGGRGGFRPNRGREGFDPPRDNHFSQQNASNTNYQNNYRQQNGYVHQHNPTAPPIPNISVPNTPNITPQNSAYPPMTPSPITPLPNVPFNFGRFQPPTNFSSFPAPPPPTMPGLPPPPPFPHTFNYQQPYQHQQSNNYQLQQFNAAISNPAGEGQPSYLSGAWANNPAVAAALQRQIEEQRRGQGQ